MENIIVEIEPCNSSNGHLKARANVLVPLGEQGMVQILGLCVLETDGAELRVCLPTRRGKNEHQYFDTVRLFGPLRDSVIAAVLDAYRERVQ